ncbi:ABC transporter permease [Caulobacter mirabilis]|uniref:ABC transporter n=1 Tax=Caulobacter mirabilis TaxID=69666 RepID=A0A2D2AWJ2_9CAUL|nr:ABC transporter permease [Caulobacter mirabilis]ATQ42380.1 ABC transporter [Caulobacter mirabilis]
MTFAMFRVMALELWRDRGALVMTFLLPPLVFLIFATVFAGATGENIQLKLVVADEARTATSRRLVEALVADPDLRAEVAPDGTGEAVRKAVRSGKADAGLIVAGDPASGEAPLVIVADPSRAVAAPLTQARVQQALARSLPDVALARAVAGVEPVLAPLTPGQRARAEAAGEALRDPKAEPAKPEAELFRREDVSGAQKGGGTIVYYAGAVTILFALFSAMHGALTILDERASGIADRILSGPSGMTPVINGKFLFLLAQGIVQAFTIFGVAIVVYRTPVLAHFGLWLVTTVLTAAAAAGLSLAVVSFCRSRGQAQMLSTFVILVLAAIGGSMAPRFLMPAWLQTVGWATPHAWAIEAYQSILWRDGGVASVYVAWLVLAGVGLVGLLVARGVARLVR